MACRERLEAFLQQHSIPYEIQRHPVAYTAQRVADSEHLPGRLLAKVVLVVADGKLEMLVVPGPTRVDWASVAKAIGTDEVRLAHESEFARAFPDCEVGAMPPFGGFYDLPVWVDEQLARLDTIYFQAGTHTETMSLHFADYARVVQPNVVRIVAQSPPREAVAGA
jgi:Ala-tRNA(Pro) deacylase